MTNFHEDDYSHTATLLRSPNEKIVQAALSNNLNIIINALDVAANMAALKAIRAWPGQEPQQWPDEDPEQEHRHTR